MSFWKIYLSYMHNLMYKNFVFVPAKEYDSPAAQACRVCSVNQQAHAIMSSRTRHSDRGHRWICFTTFRERLSENLYTISPLIAGELNEIVLPDLFVEFVWEIRHLPTLSTGKFDESVCWISAKISACPKSTSPLPFYGKLTIHLAWFRHRFSVRLHDSSPHVFP